MDRMAKSHPASLHLEPEQLPFLFCDRPSTGQCAFFRFLNSVHALLTLTLLLLSLTVFSCPLDLLLGIALLSFNSLPSRLLVHDSCLHSVSAARCRICIICLVDTCLGSRLLSAIRDSCSYRRFLLCFFLYSPRFPSHSSLPLHLLCVALDRARFLAFLPSL